MQCFYILSAALYSHMNGHCIHSAVSGGDCQDAELLQLCSLYKSQRAVMLAGRSEKQLLTRAQKKKNLHQLPPTRWQFKFAYAQHRLSLVSIISIAPFLTLALQPAGLPPTIIFNSSDNLFSFLFNQMSHESAKSWKSRVINTKSCHVVLVEKIRRR